MSSARKLRRAGCSVQNASMCDRCCTASFLCLSCSHDEEFNTFPRGRYIAHVRVAEHGVLERSTTTCRINFRIWCSLREDGVPFARTVFSWQRKRKRMPSLRKRCNHIETLKEKAVSRISMVGSGIHVDSPQVVTNRCMTVLGVDELIVIVPHIEHV